MSALSRSRGKLAKLPPGMEPEDGDEATIAALDVPMMMSCDPQAYSTPLSGETVYSGSSTTKTLVDVCTLPTGKQVFSWPTGDPRHPSGIINFTLSPPPSPPLTPIPANAPSPEPQSRPASPTKRDSRTLSAIASLFQGESAPIALGFVPSSPTKEVADAHDAMEWPFVAKRSPNQSTRLGSPTKNARSSPALSRFSLFTGLLSPAKSDVLSGTENHRSTDPDDIWLGLDVRTALQRPDGPGDPAAPPTFESLLSRAEDLLSRLQDAYRDRVIAAADAHAEVAAQQEETDEALTRAQHLKHQLDELSTKSEEQDNVIMELVQDLAEEKEARQADARARTIRMIDTNVGAQEKKRTRQSIQSVSSDSGFESNDSIAPGDDDTISATRSMSAVSYCESPNLEFARHASLNRGAASLVYTNSTRVSNAQIEEEQKPDLRLQIANKRGSVAWKGLRKPIAIATPTAVQLSQNDIGSEPSSEYDEDEENLRFENQQLKERNKFLEAELEAVKRMIEDVMLIAPPGTSSRKDSAEHCS